MPNTPYFRWIPYAFVRVILFFGAGILTGIFLPDVIHEQVAKYCFFSLVSGYSIIFILHRINKLLFVNLGWLGLTALFFAGYLQVLFHTESRRQDHIVHLSDQVSYYKVQVINYPEEKKNSWKQEVRVSQVFTSGKWKKSEGKILLYLSRKDFSEPFRYGDLLLIQGNPDRVQPPSNPHEFNYQRFLAFRNIYHQHFLRKDNIIKLGNEPPSRFMAFAQETRSWAHTTLKRYIHGDQEQAIASALILGLTDGLDNDLMDAYAASGAMHVLAVSGLHVGIIYGVILLILTPLKKYRHGKWLLALISILALWSYALVAGLSPSVLRAVTMFSVIAIARATGQTANIYNTLAASAFFLLCYDPYLVMSVGFQLSYLAVLGIVYLHPRIYNLAEPKYWLMDKIWELSSVSIAAQLATFSLGLLYFHQFPVYFLLANLFVIPGSFIVLLGGIVILLTSVFSSVARVLGWLLENNIKLVNQGIFIVEDLPGSRIDNVYLSSLQCFLIGAILIFFLLMLKHRKFKYFTGGVVLTLLFSVLQWYHSYKTYHQERLTVYKISGHSTFEIITSGKSYFFSDSLFQSTGKEKFHIGPNRLACGVKKIYNGDDQPFCKSFQGCLAMKWDNISILQIVETDFSFPESVDVDLLILSNNAIGNLNLIDKLKCKRIIIDSSNSFYLAERLFEEASTKKIPVHSLWHQGAYDILI